MWIPSEFYHVRARRADSNRLCVLQVRDHCPIFAALAAQYVAAVPAVVPADRQAELCTAASAGVDFCVREPGWPHRVALVMRGGREVAEHRVLLGHVLPARPALTGLTVRQRLVLVIHAKTHLPNAPERQHRPAATVQAASREVWPPSSPR